MRKSFLLILFFLSSFSVSFGQDVERYLQGLEVAGELIGQGKATEAIKLLKELRNMYGDDPPLIQLLKRAYLSTKSYDQVEKLIRDDLAKNPRAWRPHCELADLQFKTQNEEEARMNLNKAIDLAPNEKITYLEVAFVYLKNGLTSDAIDTYKLARLHLNDPRVFSLDLAGIYEALTDYKQAVDEYFLYMRDDSTKFPLIEDRVNRLIQTEENLDGIQLALEERINDNPQDKYSHKLYGDLLFRRGNLKPAFETYKTVDRLFGGKGKFILSFAQKCQTKRFFDQAIDASQFLLSKSPSKELAVQAKFSIANSYEGLERYKDAISTYQETIEECQKETPFGFASEMAQSYYQIGEIKLSHLKKADEAFLSYQQVISNYPESDRFADALVRLGDCLMTGGNLDSAAHLFENALNDPRAESKEEEIKFKLTEIEFYRGNFEEALEGYERQVSDFPKGFYVNNSLERVVIITENQSLDRYLLFVFAQALLEELQGKFDSTLLKLEKIISAKSATLSDKAQFEKAKIYRKKKKFSSALDVFEELIEKYPQSFYCAKAEKVIGDIYNYDLEDRPKAIRAYEKVLKDYPRSVFVDEVRGRLKELKKDSS
ncbi:MAG: tetratricopeptide repeat protein [candidate division Zixibacteria bacterium]|nr:tetratricopeptide repeat protein [candidate division Zixibacteria bacterium]